MNGRSWTCVALGLAALALGVVCAEAGGQQPTMPSQAARVQTDASREASRSLTRLALMDLRLQLEPGMRDLQIADLALAYAADKAQDDAELLRRRVELAARMGDEDALLDRTREVIRLDPQDTVAQLRLITMTLGRIQTAEARLEATERFLGARGSNLDASIRSQLALDAALLARELGEGQKFISLLSLATDLDGTNKEAAALAAAYYASARPDDAIGQAELQVALLLADPVDPQVLISLARLGAEHGDWASASRLHRAARDLMSRASGGLDEWAQVQRMVLDWHIKGPREPVRELSTQIQAMRHDAQALIQSLTEQGLPTTDITPPDELNLPPLPQRVRVLAAHAADDEEEMDRGFADLALTVRLVRNRYEEEVRTGRMSPEEAREVLVGLNLQRFLLHSITDRNFQGVFNAVQQAGLLDDPAMAEAFRGWIALRTGDTAGAIEAFEGWLALRDDPTAAIGLGLAYETSNRVDDAVEVYRQLFGFNPLAVEAAWARSRAWSLAQVDVSQTPVSSDVARALGDVPAWISDAAASPLGYMTLEAELVDAALDPAEAVMVRLRVRNTAPIPVGVGPDRPISSRVLLVPELEVGAEGRDQSTPSEPIDLARRLRLKPREAIEAVVWASPGYTGWLMQTRATQATRVRFRVLQDFVLSGQTLTAGALGLRFQTDSGVRGQLPGLRQGAAQLVERMRLLTDEDVGEMAITLRAMAFQPPEARRSDQELASLAAAWAERYPALSPAGRVVMLIETPHGGMSPAMEPFSRRVRELLAREQDETVLAAGLLTQVSIAEDPLLDLPQIDASPRLAQLRDLLRERLAGRGPSYSRAGASLTSLLGSGVPGTGR